MAIRKIKFLFLLVALIAGSRAYAQECDLCQLRAFANNTPETRAWDDKQIEAIQYIADELAKQMQTPTILQIKADVVLDTKAKIPFTDQVIGTEMHVAERTGEVNLFLNNGKMDFVLITPDKIKPKNACRRRVFSPQYMGEIPADEFRTLFSTDIPQNDWVQMGRSEVDPEKGGIIHLKANNPDGSTFQLFFPDEHGTPVETVSKGDFQFQLQKLSDGHWKLYYLDSTFSRRPVSEMALKMVLGVDTSFVRITEIRLR